jgi:hypothetical protein
MPMSEARAADVRNQLHQRIAAIAGLRSNLDHRQLVQGIDDIRSMAQSSGFGTVACIAGRLESALARETGSATLLCYLDAMDDAVKLEPVRAETQVALLASIALRVGH